MVNDKIRPEMRALAERGNITLDEWKRLALNSWERELLMPKLTDEALLYLSEKLLQEVPAPKSRPLLGYSELITGFLVPELMKRLKEKGE